MSCGVGCRHRLDPTLLCLWRGPVATAPIRPLAWEPPCAARVAQEMAKRQKNKTKQKKTFPIIVLRAERMKHFQFKCGHIGLLCLALVEVSEAEFHHYFVKTTIFCFVFGRAQGVWKNPGQRWNPCHSSDPSCCSDNTRSLTCCTTREL